MKQRLTLVLALVLAAAAVFLMQLYVKTNEPSEGRETDMVEVVVAARELNRGETIDTTMVTKGKVPKRYLHKNAIGHREVENTYGQELVNPIPEGHVILWSDLATLQSTLKLSQAVSAGKRAISLSVDQVTGVSGHIRPDDWVDVVGTFSVPNEVTMKQNTGGGDAASQLIWQAMASQSGAFSVKKVTLTVLQSVKVLAVGGITGGGNLLNAPTAPGMDAAMGAGLGQLNSRRQSLLNASLNSSGYKTITVLVSPLEAEVLAFCADNATLSLTLRGPEDTESVELPKVTLADILELKFEEQKKTTAPVAPRPTGPTIIP